MSADAPHISVIIPAFNEEAYLPRLLRSLDVARARYHGAVEVIVADNASTDRTAEVAASFGARVVPVEQRCIAAARNGGARAARGDVLCFIDADSSVHPDSLRAVDEALADDRCVGGATGVSMERWSPGIVAAWCVMVPLVWVIGVDTGLVFCRRVDFEALGGFDEGLRFAEDVVLYLRLKRLGRTRRQRFVRLRRVKALCSTRKWDHHGDWHYLLMVLKAPVYFTLMHRRMDAFADRYWYGPLRPLDDDERKRLAPPP